MEIAPGRAGAGDPQHGLEEQPVVGRAAPGIAGLSGKQRCNPRPLFIAQCTSIQGWPPFSSLESKFADQGNLEASVRSHGGRAERDRDLIEAGLS
jgi:hypothetical protein